MIRFLRIITVIGLLPIAYGLSLKSSFIFPKSFSSQVKCISPSNFVVSSNTRQYTSRLLATDTSTPSSSSAIKTFDPIATANYVLATGVEVGLTSTFLALFQRYALSNFMSIGLNQNYISGAVVAVFLFLSFRQRVFSPLDNRRPSASMDDPVFKNRLRPSWQPPPLAFPIIWTTIGLLRSVSATMIYQSTSTLVHPAIIAFVTHLAIGDTWNTINNVENRLGTSVVGAFLVWLSLAWTLFQYYQVNRVAAFILSPSFLWISIANFLVFTIWQLNYDRFNSPSLFPSKEEGPPSPWRYFSR